MNPEDKEFKKLQNKWYAKLAKEGFEDIEQNEDTLKNWHSFEKVKGRHAESAWEQKETYYRYVGWFLHDNKFKTPFDRQLWEWRAQGKSIRAMTRAFNGLGIPAYKDKVHKRLKELEKEMFKLYANRED